MTVGAPKSDANNRLHSRGDRSPSTEPSAETSLMRYVPSELGSGLRSSKGRPAPKVLLRSEVTGRPLLRHELRPVLVPGGSGQWNRAGWNAQGQFGREAAQPQVPTPGGPVVVQWQPPPPTVLPHDVAELSGYHMAAIANANPIYDVNDQRRLMNMSASMQFARQQLPFGSSNVREDFERTGGENAHRQVVSKTIRRYECALDQTTRGKIVTAAAVAVRMGVGNCGELTALTVLKEGEGLQPGESTGNLRVRALDHELAVTTGQGVPGDRLVAGDAHKAGPPMLWRHTDLSTREHPMEMMPLRIQSHEAGLVIQEFNNKSTSMHQKYIDSAIEGALQQVRQLPRPDVNPPPRQAVVNPQFAQNARSAIEHQMSPQESIAMALAAAYAAGVYTLTSEDTVAIQQIVDAARNLDSTARPGDVQPAPASDGNAP